MNTLQTTPDCMPIDREPRTMSWLQMARVNFPGNPIIKPNIVFGDRYLQRAVEHGHALAMKIDVLGESQADEIIDGPMNARRLRLYLAAVEGELVHAETLDGAEFTLGIRNADGSVKGEWL